MIASTQVNIL